MRNPDLLEKTASKLSEVGNSLKTKPALIGLDGFVDEIVRMVDKRQSLTEFSTIPTLSALADRIAHAAGKSANIELVVQKMKLGGNGPIMANALAAFGVPVTYIGNLGYPTLHPVFEELAKRARVISIANPGHTDALEFDDGKLMLGKIESLNDITWENLMQRVGEQKLVQLLSDAQLVGLENWTMIPYMSDIWENLLQKICPRLPDACKNHFIFFDLADPAKRLAEDIRAALELIASFQNYFQVILGTNEKEGFEIAEVLGVKQPNNQKEAMRRMAQEIRNKLGVYNVIIHPTQYAVAASAEEVKLIDGPWEPKPLISTGAGDHFNAGFCLGQLLGFDLEMSLLTGVTTSGFYVRTAKSPDLEDLISFMKNWPTP
ncbi:MAG: carbohydrate kinase family protein [candidate division KSB1 bacterium]|nr:carbohydrate kinase family protein [candidate division KSB1 bacterium]MDZ7302160.1 carbohydrate kinase family protein [candidate division KSB1 bacterium]MDZ7311269.1 carbohydrate kinase family protein [candidate division KSB1 bacterium]